MNFNRLLPQLRSLTVQKTRNQLMYAWVYVQVHEQEDTTATIYDLDYKAGRLDLRRVGQSSHASFQKSGTLT